MPSRRSPVPMVRARISKSSTTSTRMTPRFQVAGAGTIQATTNLGSLPIGPWAGLGVLAAWATAALFSGSLLLRLRDA